MSTRKEYAQEMADKPYSEQVLNLVYTGKVLTVGNLDEEIPSDPGDPTAISTIVPELTTFGKIFTAAVIAKRSLTNNREGFQSMSYTESLKRRLEVNKKSFKRRSDVEIFEKTTEIEINA